MCPPWSSVPPHQENPESPLPHQANDSKNLAHFALISLLIFMGKAQACSFDLSKCLQIQILHNVAVNHVLMDYVCNSNIIMDSIKSKDENMLSDFCKIHWE